ncbi:MAG: cytidylate kinase-like family protein [Candidatus Latescibacterota bacterium]|jgi:cytidylate kinase
MTPASSLERFLNAHSKLREKEEEKPRERPFVTISREAGAGGHTVGQRVVELLNKPARKAPWTLFDKQLVDLVIEKHNLPKNLSKYMNEAGVHAFEDFVAELVGLHPAADTFIRKTNETILALAKMGNAVIIGRGASYVTKGLPGGFHVRLVASKAKRLKWLMDHRKVDEKEAASLLKRTDEDRREYIRDATGGDATDVLSYDCVLNTTRLSCEDAAEMIAHHIQSR